MNALLANDAALVGMALQGRQCGRKAYRYGPSAREIIGEKGLCCFSALPKPRQLDRHEGGRLQLSLDSPGRTVDGKADDSGTA